MILFCHKIQTMLESQSFICAEEPAGWSDGFELVVSFPITVQCVERSEQRARVQAEKRGNIAFKGKTEPNTFHGERQSGANERQYEWNAVWLILGSLSARFYWERWDDDRWISVLTVGVEGRVIVAERRQVFSVSCHVRRSQSIRAHGGCGLGGTNGCSLLATVAGVTPVAVVATQVVMGDAGLGRLTPSGHK